MKYVLAMVLLVAAATVYSAEPVESPDVSMSLREIQAAFPSMSLTEQLRIYGLLTTLTRRINDRNRTQWEAIRNPLIQHKNVTVYAVAGTDSAFAVFDKEFYDTSYSVTVTPIDHVTTHSLNNGSLCYSCYKLSRDTVVVTAILVPDSIHFSVIAVGKRK